MAVKRMRDIKVRYVVPKAMPLVYANDFAVTATGNDVVLSFFQTDHPVRIGSDSSTIDANCVARIVLTPAGARELLGMFAATFKVQHPDAVAEGIESTDAAPKGD